MRWVGRAWPRPSFLDEGRLSTATRGYICMCMCMCIYVVMHMRRCYTGATTYVHRRSTSLGIASNGLGRWRAGARDQHRRRRHRRRRPTRPWMRPWRLSRARGSSVDQPRLQRGPPRESTLTWLIVTRMRRQRPPPRSLTLSVDSPLGSLRRAQHPWQHRSKGFLRPTPRGDVAGGQPRSYPAEARRVPSRLAQFCRAMGVE